MANPDYIYAYFLWTYYKGDPEWWYKGTGKRTPWLFDECDSMQHLIRFIIEWDDMFKRNNK